MSAITAPNLAPTAPAAPASPVAPVINPPPSVAALEPGTIVQGTVAGRDKQGLLLVKTDAGNIAIQTQQQIPPGAKLQLEIQAQGSQLQVVILSAERPLSADASAAAQLLSLASPLSDDGGAVSTQGLGANLAQALASKGLPPSLPAGVPAGLVATVAAGLIVAEGTATSPSPLPAGTVATALLAQATSTSAGPLPRTAFTAYGSPQFAAQASSQATTGPAGAPANQTAATSTPASPATTIPSAQEARNQAIQGQTIQNQAAQNQATQGQAAQIRAQVTPAAVILAAQGAVVPAAGPIAPGPTAPATPTAALQTGAPALPGAAPAATVTSQVVQGVQAAVANLAAHDPAKPPSGAAPSSSSPGPAVSAAPNPLQSGAPPGATSGVPAGTVSVAPATPTRPGPTGAPTSTAAPSALPTSGALSVRILAVALPTPAGIPALPQSVVPPSGTAPVLTGTVLFTTPQGQPVIQTGAGVLTVNVRADLPIGSEVTLEVLGEAPPTALRPAPATSAAAPAPLVSLSRQWPTLDETFDALRQIDPQLAQSVQRALLPQPGPHLGSGMLFFMSALKGGDVRAWLGEPATRALDGAGKGRLLAKLNDEFKELSRGGEVSEGEWRGFFMPVHDGQHVQQIRLFVHHRDSDGKDEGDDAEGTRFMLDVELSRMGPVQIDGLVRDKRLDLVVRTREALPDEMRHDINRIFDDAGNITGFKGVLTFQAGPKMPPTPLAHVVGHRPDVVV